MNLPPLREELRLTEGPRSHDGQPGWTLQDPSANRFFRLDWPTFEILCRWSLGGPEQIARQVAAQTTLRPTAQDVMGVLEFAQNHQLLRLAGTDNSAALADLHRRARPVWWRWLIHNYLFFRVPLINPAALLRRLDHACGWVFRPGFWWLTLAVGFTGLVLLWRNWSTFRATFVDFTDFHGFLGYAVVLIGIKVLHEFGHGLVATHHGCRVPAMGVAFLVMTPVAYTDTNEAWLLNRRKPRLQIGAAGIIVELTLAAWATLAWCLLPDGLWRSAAYMVATVTWIKSLLINLSPIMRFDGYYLLSDALDIPNLHSRCFALGRWRLREWLFGLGEPPPEHFARPLRAGLVALAYFIWIYRLIVFVGIAIFVYHFFFKALGIVLFVVEIGWFVVLPVYSEMKIWFQKRAAILASVRSRWTAAVALTLLVLACLPLPQRIRLSAQLHPADELRVVAHETARIESLPVGEGESVSAGVTLARLVSPVLDDQLAAARARLQRREAEWTAAAADPQARGRLPVLAAGVETARAAEAEAALAVRRLTPLATFDGVFHLADIDLRPGEWIGRGEPIGSLVAPQHRTVVGYLDEKYTHLVNAGQEARFYADGREQEPLRLRVVGIEVDATRNLTHPMLAADAGGDVKARVLERDLVPEKAVYRITFEVISAEPLDDARIRRGRVVVRAGSESLVTWLARGTLTVLWRELGF